MSIYFESALEKIAKMISRRYGINVFFEGTKAKTDGKNIFLPYFKELTDELKLKIHGFLDHEVSHILFTDFTILSQIKTKFVADMNNALEDIRIEKKMRELHPGTDYYLSPLRNEVNKKHQDNLSKMTYLEKLVFASQLYVQKLPFTSGDTEFDSIFEKIKPTLNKFDKALTSKRILELANEIAAILEIADEELEPPKSKGKSSEEDESSESDESGEGESESDKSGESESESEKTESKKSKEEKTSKEDESAKSTGKKDKAVSKETAEKIKKELKTSKPSSYTPKFDLESVFNETIQEKIDTTAKEKVLIENGKLAKININDVSIPVSTRFDVVKDYTGGGDKGEYLKLKKSIKKVILPLKGKLEKLLKIKEDAKWKLERESGKINPNSLAKMQYDKTYRTIFKEFHKNDTSNVSVQILIDQSGSMSGSGKIKVAQQTAIALSECLKDLNIDFEVTGFYSDYSSEMQRLSSDISSYDKYNRFNEKLKLNIFKRFDSSDLSGLTKIYVGGNNPDGECVKWAASRLMERKNKRKILFVLSDGMPAADARSQATLENDLRLKVHQIERSGIEVVGFGILTDAVQKFYKNNVVITDLNKLPTVCMVQLSKLLLKNNR